MLPASGEYQSLNRLQRDSRIQICLLLPPSVPLSFLTHTWTSVVSIFYQNLIFSFGLPEHTHKHKKRLEGLNNTHNGNDSTTNNKGNPNRGCLLCCVPRTVYRVAYRQVSRAAPTSHFYTECCPGWRRFHSHNCNQGNFVGRVTGLCVDSYLCNGV